MPIRHAQAHWQGTLKEGSGRLKVESGAFEGPYTWADRFADGGGANPEELIGAAHAGCFSMAFAAALGRAGFEPRSVRTTADVHLVKTEAGFAIPRIELRTEAEVPGIDAARFQEIAAGAKAGCPVSKALAGVEISLDARLV